MKIWFFIIGIVIFSIMFFTAGMLVGFSICKKNMIAIELVKEKPMRSPSNQHKNPLIDKPLHSKTKKILDDKIRRPTDAAIAKSQIYKN